MQDALDVRETTRSSQTACSGLQSAGADIQAQLAEERERSAALEADQREAREAARKQQTAARREGEHLREHLAAAEAAAEVAARKTSDLAAQLQVLDLFLLFLCLGIQYLSYCRPRPSFYNSEKPAHASCPGCMHSFMCK